MYHHNIYIFIYIYMYTYYHYYVYTYKNGVFGQWNPLESPKNVSLTGKMNVEIIMNCPASQV
jgi:hypothetical protein